MKAETTHFRCISEDQLYKYLDGKLSSEENRAIELHLTDCDLCADALEGFRILNSGKKSSEIVSALKNRISTSHQTKTKIKKLDINIWQIAAVFTILFLSISSYYFINNLKRDKLADSNTKTPPFAEISKATFPDSMHADYALQKKNKNAEAKDKAIMDQATTSAESTNSTVKTELELVETGSISKSAFNNKDEILLKEETKSIHETEFSEVAAAAQSESVDNMKTPSANGPAISNEESLQELSTVQARKVQETTKEKRITTAGKKSISTAEIKAWIEQGSYAKALEAIDHSPSTAENEYLKSRCYELTGHMSKALATLDKLITEDKGPFFEEALIYKAAILIKNNKPDEARLILERLIHLKGKKYDEAKQMLGRL